MKKINVAGVIVMMTSSVAMADIVYTPVNPSFGGNPLNSNHLLSTADIQNQFSDDFSSLFGGQDSLAEQFVDQLSGAVISGAAAELTEAIFEDGAPPTGEFTLDGATISYVLDPITDRATVTIDDGTTISVVEIPNPTTN